MTFSAQVSAPQHAHELEGARRRRAARCGARASRAIGVPLNAMSPASQRERARDHVQHGGLARAVRPDQADDLARLDRERQVVDRDQPAERLADRGRREQCARRCGAVTAILLPAACARQPDCA